ncbi:hypothetical protein F5H01DRAFT_321565 [Linnemannia elongata]|nr:hypothetical protein F5H01DRAFT_321565 [Linnemannia elongata]
MRLFSSGVFLVVLAWLSLAKAQDKKCLADYIVTKCLTSEASKAQDSPATDYDCFSSAYEKSFNRILLPGGNSFDNGDIDLTMPYIIDDYTETEVLDPVAQPHTPPPITLPPPPPPPSPPSTLNFLSLSLRRRPSITALDTYTISPILGHGHDMSSLEYATFDLSVVAISTSSDSPSFRPLLHVLTVSH